MPRETQEPRKTEVRFVCAFDGCHRLTAQTGRRTINGPRYYQKYCNFHGGENPNKEASRREYLGIYRGELRRKNHEEIMRYLELHPCSECGERDIIVLQFHHRTGDKSHPISQMLGSYQWPDILAEISKCAVLCANCHLRQIAADQKHYKLRRV